MKNIKQNLQRELKKGNNEMKITESHSVCWCRLQNKDTRTVINVPLLSTLTSRCSRTIPSSRASLVQRSTRLTVESSFFLLLYCIIATDTRRSTSAYKWFPSTYTMIFYNPKITASMRLQVIQYMSFNDDGGASCKQHFRYPYNGMFDILGVIYA